MCQYWRSAHVSVLEKCTCLSIGEVHMCQYWRSAHVSVLEKCTCLSVGFRNIQYIIVIIMDDMNTDEKKRNNFISFQPTEDYYITNEAKNYT